MSAEFDEMNGLLILLAALNVADCWTTWQTIRFGGYEMNPFVRWSMKEFGNGWGMALPKIIMLAVVWVVVIDDRTSLWFISVILFFYAGLVVWNYIQLQEAKRGKS